MTPTAPHAPPHRWHALLASLLLPFCAAAVHAEPPSAATHGARQLVVVTTADWDADQGILRRFERDAGESPWREVGAFAVGIGRNGSAWGDGLHARDEQGDGPEKREGDGRSPAGVFDLGIAFGYAPAADTELHLPYRQMDAGDYCIDVPDSPLYNRIVDAREVGADAVKDSTEPMRLDLHNEGDPRYRLGFVVEHNPANMPRRGSCIFAHLWRRPGEATAGCTAMAEGDMRALLAWLDPTARPRFVLLPEAEYDRHQPGWQLPPRGEIAR
ncbi:L,D-transpeptidase family protein [Pseudoxanthomonas putridarboris]|uniref:L,D-peptidoglycan transpeptidase YkuD, ErfK/YbiS/YcfS/YnhG family n=1 Tax=Pseudoxanthomonas putridarboris TaxID=752605 RepID=A0ABU9IWG4_9GAMM